MRCSLLLLALSASSCVISAGVHPGSGGAGEGSDAYDGQLGLRVEHTLYGNYDADSRRFSYPDPVVRESADFDAEGLGLTLEAKFAENFSASFSYRDRDTEDYRGNLRVDDSFQEFAIAARVYGWLEGPVNLFGEFGLSILTGLDIPGANTLPGATLGVGTVWHLHEDLSLEVMGRYVTALSEDDDEWFFQEKNELDAVELLLGLTYWF